MFKIKFLFLSALCFCLLSGALPLAAQDNEILFSSGTTCVRQSEVDQLIAFYEWAFETEFSPEQRGKYRNYVVQEFISDPAASQIAMSDLLATFKKIQTLDQADQQRKRNIFTNDFVSEIRDRTDDKGGKFLLSVYDAAHKTGMNTAIKP